MRLAVGLLGAVLFALPAASKPPTPHKLSFAEAQRWIAAAKAQKTPDGVTLIEALQNAQKLRPNEFRFGKFDIGYDPVTGEPDCVTVETWIGTNRDAEDSTNIMLPIKQTENKVRVAIPRSAGIFLEGLRGGEESLLSAIDEQYQAVCVDFKTRAKSC